MMTLEEKIKRLQEFKGTVNPLDPTVYEKLIVIEGLLDAILIILDTFEEN